MTAHTHIYMGSHKYGHLPAHTQVKYQDVLLRRDLTQRVWAEVGPRMDPLPARSPAGCMAGFSSRNAPCSSAAPASPAALTTSISSSSSSSPPHMQPGHWFGRLSWEQVSRLNARAEALFDAGRERPYVRLLQRLARLGLVTQVRVWVGARMRNYVGGKGDRFVACGMGVRQ